MEQQFNLSKSLEYPEGDEELGGYISENELRKFIKILKAKIKTISKHQVVNGKANPEYIKYFSEGERIGMENQRELALQIIDELVGDLK